jgi:hypothetical protein
MPHRSKIPDLPNAKKLELAERSRINDLSVNYIEKQRKLHADRIHALKQETGNLMIQSSNKEAIESSEAGFSTSKSYNNHIKQRSYNATDSRSDINDISDETLLRRLSLNRRKSTLLKDIYELKHVSTNNRGLLKKSELQNNHKLDVYLDYEESPERRERLPSLANLYKKANQLKLIERFNPQTLQSFNELIKASSLHRSNPTYDFGTQSNSLKEKSSI